LTSDCSALRVEKGELQVKLIRTFGLTAIAAVAAMALVGVSSASATSTALCSEASSTAACPSGKLISSVHFVAKNPELLTSLLNVTCAEALLAGTVEGTLLGAPLGITVTELKYTTCKTGSTSCEVKATHLGLLDLLKTAVDLGTLTDLAVGGFHTSVSVVCGKLINCEYEGANLSGHALSATGTNKGLVVYTKSVVTKVAGGFLCPTTSELDATFESLTNAWIRE
jgi:hypothetical protein